MSEFDALLDEVLSHHANAEVPLGLERRIGSRLATNSRDGLRKRTVWLEAMAAMLAFGLLAMLPLLRPKPATNEATIKAKTQAVPAVAYDREIAPPPSVQSGGKSSIARNAMRPERTLRAEESPIAPLRIEPLAIEPIEIAALNSGIGNRKEEVR